MDVGCPLPLDFAERLTAHCRQTASGLWGGGATIYFKREELNHTGAHKVNNVLGQILLAQRMGKKRIIAENARWACMALPPRRLVRASVLNASSIRVRSMSRGRRRTCFACRCSARKVVLVESGSKTLKDAMNEVLRHG